MRHYAISIGMVLAVLATPACSPRDASKRDTSNKSTPTATLTKLRVSLPLHLSTSPLMIARDEGFFRDEGLDVEFIPGLPHDESLVALVSGHVDVRPGPVSVGLLSAVRQGAKIRITAGAGFLARNGCTFYGIALRPGLDSTQSASVKRIRTSLDGSPRYLTHAMLEQHKLNLKMIESVRLPEGVIQSSLNSGAIDAAAVQQPLLSRIAKDGRPWLSGQDAAPDYQWSLITFGERLLTDDRDAGIRFLRAYRRGVAQYDQGKTPRNVEIIAKGTGESPEVIQSACWLSFQPDSRINWASIDAFQRFAISDGLMEHPITQAQVWDSTFLTASDSGNKSVNVPARR